MKLSYSQAFTRELLEDLVVPPRVFMHEEIERGLHLLRIELDKDEVVKALKEDNARMLAAIKRWSERHGWQDAKFIDPEYDAACRDLHEIAREK